VDGRRSTTFVVSAVLGVVLTAAAVATLLIVRPGASTSGPGVSPTAQGSNTGSDVAASVPLHATASATCMSSPSVDAGGNPTNYAPANVLDGQQDTAWRCDGDGSGVQFEIDLNHSATVNRIGIIPGLAKTDPYDNTDRYLQGRRISAVRYTLDGASYEQRLDTDPNNRSLQSVAISATSTTRILITILSSVPGSPVGDLPPTDKVAISEARIWTS
jgi:hypothetical protein